MINATEKCRVCGAAKEYGVRHAHCTGCGVLIGPKATHPPTCPKKGLPPGAYCPKCGKLLAGGAWCPAHGNPYDNLRPREVDGAPK
jgi:RNA polymerase subunit RPABC4/transcription elongation factor Spt4